MENSRARAASGVAAAGMRSYPPRTSSRSRGDIPSKRGARRARCSGISHLHNSSSSVPQSGRLFDVVLQRMKP